jgi:uroporphyrinogen-III synthase
MVKNGDKNTTTKAGVVKKVLITQPKPEGEKSPYFDLAKKHNIELDFHPFIIIDGIPAKEFRKQKVDMVNFTSAKN